MRSLYSSPWLCIPAGIVLMALGAVAVAVVLSFLFWVWVYELGKSVVMGRKAA